MFQFVVFVSYLHKIYYQSLIGLYYDLVCYLLC